MRLLKILFGPSGRIGRAEFVLGLLSIALLFWLGIQISLAALPSMAELLAPRGINAGFALNAIWLLLGLMLVWSLMALGAKRLRDRSRSPWWIVVVVIPLAGLALVNDAVFLLSKRLFVPPQLQWAVLIESGLIGLWILGEGMLGPARIKLQPPPKAEEKPRERDMGLRDRLAKAGPQNGGPSIARPPTVPRNNS